MVNLYILFILLLTSLVSKYDESFWRIYHLSHSKNHSVNNQISNKKEKLWYIKFKEPLKFILDVKRHYISIKRDITDVFQNVLVAYNINDSQTLYKKKNTIKNHIYHLIIL